MRPCFVRPRYKRGTVSIHAPTWGATPIRQRQDHHISVSIHAPTWGATLLLDRVCPLFLFQSTHPHGVRHSIHQNLTNVSRVSIHAPTWGATSLCVSLGLSFDVSIHAPTWGATLLGGVRASTQKSFNPRTHMGCDSMSYDLSRANYCFNPRTHMGCDWRVSSTITS